VLGTDSAHKRNQFIYQNDGSVRIENETEGKEVMR